MVSHLQPQKILKQIEKNISDHTYRDKNYIILEQAAIKAVRNNDFLTYMRSLDIIFNKQKFFLNNLLDKEIDKEYNYNSRDRDIEEIISFFFGIQNRIYYEIIKERNENFLIYYLGHLKEIHKLLLKLMATRSYRGIRNHFNDIGFNIIELKLQSVYHYYCTCLREISTTEFENIPNSNLLFQFQDNLEDFYRDLDEIEKEKKIIADIFFQCFVYDRLKFLKELSKKASEEKIEYFPSSVKWTLSGILYLAIERNGNKKFRLVLVRSILHTLMEIHIYSLDKGIVQPNYIEYPGLYDILKKIKDEESINTVGLLITKFCCIAEIENAKRDVYNLLFPLGATARGLVTDPKFKKILDEIVDCIEELLKLVAKNKKLKNVKKEEIAKELFSIRDWNNHKNRKLKNKVNRIAKKYNLKK